MTPWWERFAGRLQRELDALNNDGIKATVNEALFGQGVLELSLQLPAGAWLAETLVARFPDAYPYTRPEVFARTLKLARHQNPFEGNLCLLGRSSTQWRPSDTLAGILRTQLPALAEAVGTAPVSDDLEELQGEPVSTFLTYVPGAVIFIDSAWDMPRDVKHGTLVLQPLDDSPLRAVVRSVRDHRGQRIARGPSGDPDSDHVVAPWVRLDSPIVDNQPAAWMRAFSRAHPGAQLELRKNPRVVAFLFPEELSHRQLGDGWVFVTREYHRAHVREGLARAARAGVQDLAARFPLFGALRQKRIAVFGLGCIGAPSVLEFARSGVGEIRFTEPDIIDAGTAVRWPLGFEVAGWPKSFTLRVFIEVNYPWVRIVPYEHRVGSVLQSTRDSTVLDKMLSGVDLVYDATAERGIQHLISDLARERGIPYACISGTPGGVSGIVARIKHDGEAGCWMCFQRALDNGRIELPKLADGAEVQPPGCANVTFTGANYDLMEVALQGVRLALGTLLNNEDEKEDFLWDVAVLRHRDDDGQRVEPRWSVYPLIRDPECPACGSK